MGNPFLFIWSEIRDYEIHPCISPLRGRAEARSDLFLTNRLNLSTLAGLPLAKEQSLRLNKVKRATLQVTLFALFGRR